MTLRFRPGPAPRRHKLVNGKMGQRILAVEVSGDSARAALADRTYKSFELLSVYEQERTAGEADLSDALSRIVSAVGRCDVVISSLPGEYVAKRLLALPFTDRRRLQQVVAFALEEHLPFAVDDAVVAFARVGRESGNTLVIAAAVRRDIVRQHLELLGAAGLDPKTVTLSALALAEMLTRARDGSPGAHLVIDIESACTSIVLVDSAGTPRAMRTVGHGLDFHVNGVLRAPASSAIFAAARQTMLAHGDQERPELILAGAAAETPGMPDLVAQTLQVPVRDIGEFDYSTLIRGSAAISKRFAGCIAMLLGEAPSSPLELLNFRQGEFVFRGRSGTTAPLRIPALLAGAAALAGIVQFSLGAAVSLRQLHLLDRQIRKVTAPALGSVDPAMAQASLKAKLADMNNRLRLMGGSLGHGSPLDVLEALSRVLPPGMPAQVEMLQIDDSGMKLEGQADSFTTVDQVKRALERHDDFGQVQLDHAAASSEPGKVDFHLSATLD
jgi:Tfp pilus assembly PilM family ATPase/Tfp pilus assembly protein PilN